MTILNHVTGTDQLLVEVAGPVATVTFNNPARRNALTAQMRAALPGVLTALNADGDVWVVVATGAGEAAFMSGADISEFAARRTAPADRAAFDRGQAAQLRPERHMGLVLFGGRGIVGRFPVSHPCAAEPQRTDCLLVPLGFDAFGDRDHPDRPHPPRHSAATTPESSTSSAIDTGLSNFADPGTRRAARAARLAESRAI